MLHVLDAAGVEIERFNADVELLLNRMQWKILADDEPRRLAAYNAACREITAIETNDLAEVRRLKEVAEEELRNVGQEMQGAKRLVDEAGRARVRLIETAAAELREPASGVSRPGAGIWPSARPR